MRIFTSTFEYLVEKLGGVATKDQLEAIIDHYHEKFASKVFQSSEVRP